MKNVLARLFLIILAFGIFSQDLNAQKDKKIDDSGKKPRWAERWPKGKTFAVRASNKGAAKGKKIYFKAGDQEKWDRLAAAQTMASLRAQRAIAEIIFSQYQAGVDAGLGGKDGESSIWFNQLENFRTNSKISGATKIREYWEELEDSSNGKSYFKYYVLYSYPQKRLLEIVQAMNEKIGIPADLSENVLDSFGTETDDPDGSIDSMLGI